VYCSSTAVWQLRNWHILY